MRRDRLRAMPCKEEDNKRSAVNLNKCCNIPLSSFVQIATVSATPRDDVSDSHSKASLSSNKKRLPEKSGSLLIGFRLPYSASGVMLT